MSEIIKQMVDFSGESSQTITVGEIVENYMVPKFPKAQYATSPSGMPYIVLPFIDGNYRSDFNPVIRFEIDSTTLLSKVGNVTVYVGFIDMNTKESYLYNFGSRYHVKGESSDRYNSGNYTEIYFKHAALW